MKASLFELYVVKEENKGKLPWPVEDGWMKEKRRVNECKKVNHWIYESPVNGLVKNERWLVRFSKGNILKG